MSLKLHLFTVLTFVGSALSRPRQAPKCIEGANPFDDPCFHGIRSEVESLSLKDRDDSMYSTSTEIVQFSDTFTHTKLPQIPTRNSTVIFPGYPQGLALSYPGFVFCDVKSTELLMPTPPQVLITNPWIQDSVGRQPSIIRQPNTTSFDLRSLRFACAYYDNIGVLQILSCLVTITCAPKRMKDSGIPNGHRPTPRPMVTSTFEFTPNLDTSSLTWPGPAKRGVTAEDVTIKTTLYGTADLGGDFYDLDHCYIMLQQYSSPSPPPDVVPSVFLDDVIGVAYIDAQETG